MVPGSGLGPYSDLEGVVMPSDDRSSGKVGKSTQSLGYRLHRFLIPYKLQAPINTDGAING
jgi:hypothetical protein